MEEGAEDERPVRLRQLSITRDREITSISKLIQPIQGIARLIVDGLPFRSVNASEVRSELYNQNHNNKMNGDRNSHAEIDVPVQSKMAAPSQPPTRNVRRYHKIRKIVVRVDLPKPKVAATTLKLGVVKRRKEGNETSMPKRMRDYLLNRTFFEEQSDAEEDMFSRVSININTPREYRTEGSMTKSVRQQPPKGKNTPRRKQLGDRNNRGPDRKYSGIADELVLYVRIEHPSSSPSQQPAEREEEKSFSEAQEGASNFQQSSQQANKPANFFSWKPAESNEPLPVQQPDSSSNTVQPSRPPSPNDKQKKPEASESFESPKKISRVDSYQENAGRNATSEMVDESEQAFQESQSAQPPVYQQPISMPVTSTTPIPEPPIKASSNPGSQTAIPNAFLMPVDPAKLMSLHDIIKNAKPYDPGPRTPGLFDYDNFEMQIRQGERRQRQRAMNAPPPLHIPIVTPSASFFDVPIDQNPFLTRPPPKQEPLFATLFQKPPPPRSKSAIRADASSRYRDGPRRRRDRDQERVQF